MSLEDMLEIGSVNVKLLVLAAGHGWRSCAKDVLPHILLTAGNKLNYALYIYLSMVKYSQGL